MNIKINNTVPDLKLTVTECEDGSVLLAISKESALQMLSSLPVGTHFMAADQEWIILEHLDGLATRACRAEVLPESYVFSEDGDGNFAESDLWDYLNNEYYDSLTEKLGLDVIQQHEVDLTADDGSGEDMSCECYVSVMTTERRRKYRKLVPFPKDDWEWTATRKSWDADGWAHGVCWVGSGGVLGWDGCRCGYDVRPFLVLKSSIEVEVM